LAFHHPRHKRENEHIKKQSIHPSLDVFIDDTVYYLYPYQGGMGKLEDEDKGNHYDFRNQAAYRRTQRIVSDSDRVIV
jgi:hypothetical protein